jgi:hypothetical protein
VPTARADLLAALLLAAGAAAAQAPASAPPPPVPASVPPAPANAAPDFGTLFHSAEERARLDKLRRGELPDPPATRRGPPSVTGFVQRSDGRNTVWIDGRPVPVAGPRAAPLFDPRAVRDMPPPAKPEPEPAKPEPAKAEPADKRGEAKPEARPEVKR